MLAKTYCAAVVGLEATTITVEVNMTRGVMYNLSGMADTAVKESYARIMAALPNVGYKIPLAQRLTKPIMNASGLSAATLSRRLQVLSE